MVPFSDLRHNEFDTRAVPSEIAGFRRPKSRDIAGCGKPIDDEFQATQPYRPFLFLGSIAVSQHSESGFGTLFVAVKSENEEAVVLGMRNGWYFRRSQRPQNFWQSRVVPHYQDARSFFRANRFDQFIRRAQGNCHRLQLQLLGQGRYRLLCALQIGRVDPLNMCVREHSGEAFGAAMSLIAERGIRIIGNLVSMAHKKMVRTF
jgi:hypothetical protein